MGGDVEEVVEGTAKKLFIGEDGEGIGAGGLIADGLIDGRRPGLDVTRRRGAPLDLGDDRECPVAALEGGGEGRWTRQRGVEPDQLGWGDRANERRNLLTLPSHDLGEFVGHSANTEHTEPRNSKPNLLAKFSVYFVISADTVV